MQAIGLNEDGKFAVATLTGEAESRTRCQVELFV